MTLLKRVALLIGVLCVCPIFIHSQKIPYYDFSKFSVYSIEKQLFQLLNQERDRRGLSPLKNLPELVALARAHSRDMAWQDRLTHDSSDGKTYSDRLVEAGIFFLGNGENGAFSETYSSQIIHQSLLESPEHRENIYDPHFDQVGIGVIYQKDKGFYVTQDFLTSFPRKSAQEIKQNIKKLMNTERKKHDLEPLKFSSELEELAEEYLHRKTEKISKEDIPEHLGYTKIFMSRVSVIDQIDAELKKLVRDEISSAGLGVTLGRSEKNIGGEYRVVLLLVGGDRAPVVNNENLREQILKKINMLRQNQGCKKLTIDLSLSQQAELIASQMRINPSVRIRLAPGMRSDQLLMYSTNDPLSFSESVKKKIESKRFRTVGIGILITESDQTGAYSYFITLILI